MKIGIIEITDELFEAFREEEYYKDFFNKMFSKLITLDIKDNNQMALKEYKCYCEEFEDIKELETIPYYIFRYDNTDGKGLFEKKQKTEYLMPGTKEFDDYIVKIN